MIEAGSTVRIASLPGWVADLPFETQRVFRFCLGRTYQVVDKDRSGVCVLDVSRDIDARLSHGPTNLRVEADCLDEVQLRFVSEE